METCLFGVSDGSAGWVVQPFVVRANKLPVGGVCFTYHMAGPGLYTTLVPHAYQIQLSLEE